MKWVKEADEKLKTSPSMDEALSVGFIFKTMLKDLKKKFIQVLFDNIIKNWGDE